MKSSTPEGDNGALGIRVRPIESVGVYVADGSAACLSSLLAAVVAARIAGVSRIAIAAPPRTFLASPQLRYLLDRLDLREIYLMGGAHAVAALAYGTDSVAPVAVRRRRRVPRGGGEACGERRGGHRRGSGSLRSGDRRRRPRGGGDRRRRLARRGRPGRGRARGAGDAVRLAAKVERRVSARVRTLPKSPARAALKNWGAIVLVPDLEAAAVVNRIAPQCVELLLAEPLRVQDLIERAGMVVVGPWSPPALASLALGASPMLAAGAARFASPLGVWDFVRRTAVARVAAHRYPALAQAAAALAPHERLQGESLHAGSRGRM